MNVRQLGFAYRENKTGANAATAKRTIPIIANTRLVKKYVSELGEHLISVLILQKKSKMLFRYYRAQTQNTSLWQQLSHQ